jgi:hypothetical protein
MKTRLLVMVGLMVSTTMFAQHTARDARKEKESFTGYERMKRELALSDNQYASIKGIHTKYAKKRGAELKKYELRRLEERKSMQALRLEREREIRKVLTPEQSKKFEAQKVQREKNREHMKEKRKDDYKNGKYGSKKDRHHFKKNGRHHRNK